MNILCEAVRERILFFLDKNKITQYRLEHNSGVSHGTMNGIMLLKNKSVDLMTVIKIANGFDMTVSEFLNDPSFDEDNLK